MVFNGLKNGLNKSSNNFFQFTDHTWSDQVSLNLLTVQSFIGKQKNSLFSMQPFVG